MTSRERGWLLPPAALFLIAGILLGRGLSSPFWALLACLPAAAAVLLLRGRFRFAAAMILFLTFGSLLGQTAWHPALPPEGTYEVRGVVADEIRRGNYGQVRVFLSDVTLNGRPLSGGAYWTFYTGEDQLPEGLFPGREASFRASLYHPAGMENPDGYDFREELLRRGVTVGLYGDDSLAFSAPSAVSFAGTAAALRARCSAALIRVMGEDAGGYASALLLGSRSMVPSEDRAAFARLGIAHILSVSGFHTGILVWMLSFVFRLLRLRQGLRLVLNAAVLLAYCALCGMNLPVVRASLLLLALQGGKMLNRPRLGLHLLCAVAIVLLVLSPVQVTGISFRLTFGATLGLTLVTPYLSSLCPFSRKGLRSLWSSFAAAIGAQLGVIVPLLYDYQQLPLLSLLVNLPASLAAAALITADWLVLLLLPLPFLCALPAAAARWLTAALVQGVRAVSALPGITLWTPAANGLTLAGMLLVTASLCRLLRPSRRVRVLCLLGGLILTAVSLVPLPHHGTEMIRFSVGDADAAVLRDEESVWVLDTGTDSGVVSGYLRRRRLTPDAVILTHLHADHAGGLRSLLDDEIPVPVLYLPAGAREQAVDEEILLLLDALRASGTEIRELSRGDVLPLPSGQMSVLWPEKGKVRSGQDANQYSLVSCFSLQGVTLLETGDLPGAYESYAAVPADLLKAAHHGSASSTGPEFLAAVDPRAVLLSCNSPARLEAFRSRCGNIPVFSTAVCGALTLRFSEGAFTVIPFLSQSDAGGL